MHTSNTIDALVVASRKPSKGLILRSDNGTQFTSREFVQTLKELGIVHERIRYRSPEQNGHIESFHKTLKRKYVWPNDFESFQDAEKAMAVAFEDYNRLHLAVGYVPPAEFAVRLSNGNNKGTPQKQKVVPKTWVHSTLPSFCAEMWRFHWNSVAVSALQTTIFA